MKENGMSDIWMAETAACLFFPVWTHLLVYYYIISVACWLSTGNTDSVCFQFFGGKLYFDALINKVEEDS